MKASLRGLIFLWGCPLATALTCNPALQNLLVSGRDGASSLAEAVKCEGGTFDVSWQGEVTVSQTISIGAGTSVSIVRSGSANATATGDPAAPLQLFVLEEGASLSIVGVDLAIGKTAASGGLVLAGPGSRLVLEDLSLHNATAGTSGGAIAVQEGGSLVARNVYMYGGYAELFGGFVVGTGATIDLSNVLMQNGSTTISGGQGGAVHLSGGSNLTMVDSQVVKCVSFTGGGVFSKSGSNIYVRNTTFNQNYGVQLGGGISVEDQAGSVDISFCVFIGNAVNSYGGGAFIEVPFTLTDSQFLGNIAATGGAALASFPNAQGLDGQKSYVQRCYFKGNWAFLYAGGAITWGATVEKHIEDCVFEENFGVFGGAFYPIGAIGGTAGLSTHYIVRSNFSRNTASKDGGAVATYGPVKLIFQSCNFEANVAGEGVGGGLAVHAATAVEGDSLSFTGNVALQGGGAVGAAGNMSCSGCSFMGNSVDADIGEGGGIFANTAASVVEITDSAFAGNIAAYGAGLQSAGKLTVAGAKFSGNQATLFGGSVYLDSTAVGNFGDCHMSENTAGRAGGAIFSSAAAAPSLSTISFQNNVAACCHAEADVMSVGFGTDSSDGCVDLDWAAGINPSLSRCCFTGFYGVQDDCPACPEGFTCDGLGLREETLKLSSGLWRGSLEDIDDVRSCWREHSCIGGTPTAEEMASGSAYCAPGYTGPYCAVCDTNYAEGLHYKCSSCSDGAKSAAVASICLGVLAVLLVMCCAFYELWDFGSASDAIQSTNISWASCIRWTIARIRRFPFGKLRIPLVVFQINVQFVSITGIKMPHLYANFLAWLSLIDLDLSWFMSVGCLVDVSFYDRLLVTTLLPPAVGVLLLLTYTGVRYRERSRAAKAASAASSKIQPGEEQHEAILQAALATAVADQQKQQPGTSDAAASASGAAKAPKFEPPAPATAQGNGVAKAVAEKAAAEKAEASAAEAIRAASTKHASAFMLLLFIVYSTVSTVVFQTFACDDIPALGGSFLRTDYRVQCYSPTHKLYMIYAGFMVVLYPVGIPAYYAYLLWRDREAIREGGDYPAEKQVATLSLRPTWFLRCPYRSNRFFWEVPECARRLLLTGFLVFILPGTPGQAAIACLFAVGSLSVFAIFWPHRDRMDAYMYILGCLIIFMSMFYALIMVSDVSNDPQSQEVFSILLITLNVGLMIGALLQCIFILYFCASREDTTVYGVRTRSEAGARTLSASSNSLRKLVAQGRSDRTVTDATDHGKESSESPQSPLGAGPSERGEEGLTSGHGTPDDGGSIRSSHCTPVQESKEEEKREQEA